MTVSSRVLAGAALIALSATATVAEEVNVYSARKENLIKPLLDQFSQSAGIRVNLITAGADELVDRAEARGENHIG